MSRESDSREIPPDGILCRLVHKYVELSEVCYRVSVAAHDERGRFRKGPRRREHPALLKKIDLDRALSRIYERFFDSSYEVSSISTSNSRRQGSDTRSSGTGSSCGARNSSE